MKERFRFLLLALPWFSMAPSFAQGSPTQELYFAHVVAGAGYRTTLAFVNGGSTPQQVVLEFFEPNGAPLSLPIQGRDYTTVIRRIDGYAQVQVQIGEEDGGSQLRSGWARVTTGSGVSGVETIQILSPGGRLVSQASVAASEMVEAVTLAIDIGESISGTVATLGTKVGIAVANPSATEVRLRLVLCDDGGSFVAVAEDVAVVRRGSWARLLDQVFPDLDEQPFRGSLRIDADGNKLAAVGAYLYQDGFSLVPVSSSQRLPQAPAALAFLFDVELPGSVIDLDVDGELNRAAVTTTTGLHLLELPSGRLLSSRSLPLDPNPEKSEGRLSLDLRTHTLALIAAARSLALFDLREDRPLGSASFGLQLEGIEMVPGLNSVLLTQSGWNGGFPFCVFSLLSLADLKEQRLTSVLGYFANFLVPDFTAARALLVYGTNSISYRRVAFPSLQPLDTWISLSNGPTFNLDGASRVTYDAGRRMAILPLFRPAERETALTVLDLNSGSAFPAFASSRQHYVVDPLSGLVAFTSKVDDSVSVAEPRTGKLSLSVPVGFRRGKLAADFKAGFLLVADPGSGRLVGLRVIR